MSGRVSAATLLDGRRCRQASPVPLRRARGAAKMATDGELTVELMLEIRSRLLASYQEIIRLVV